MANTKKDRGTRHFRFRLTPKVGNPSWHLYLDDAYVLAARRGYEDYVVEQRYETEDGVEYGAVENE